MSKIIGIDIGGTFIKAGIVEKAIVSNEISRETPNTREEFDEILAQIISELNPGDVSAVSIAVPGLVDYKLKKIVYCPNLKFDLENIDCGLPVYIGNDADLALLGELKLRGETENIAILTLGTGLGGAFSIGGKSPIDFNLAGEIGHMEIIAEGEKCNCGHYGCFEAYVSGTAILRQAKEKINADIDSVEEVFKLARDGNEAAKNIISDFAHYLGIGIANLVNVLGIEKVVLAGQISKSADLFLEKSTEVAWKNIFAPEARNLTIDVSKNIDQIALIGAAELVKKL